MPINNLTPTDLDMAKRAQMADQVKNGFFNMDSLKETLGAAPPEIPSEDDPVDRLKVHAEGDSTEYATNPVHADSGTPLTHRDLRAQMNPTSGCFVVMLYVCYRNDWRQAYLTSTGEAALAYYNAKDGECDSVRIAKLIPPPGSKDFSASIARIFGRQLGRDGTVMTPVGTLTQASQNVKLMKLTEDVRAAYQRDKHVPAPPFAIVKGNQYCFFPDVERGLVSSSRNSVVLVYPRGVPSETIKQIEAFVTVKWAEYLNKELAKIADRPSRY
jgi:hypothetical protein